MNDYIRLRLKRVFMVVAIAAAVGTIFMLLRYAFNSSAKWADLPTLSTHDFQWIVIVLLVLNWMKGE